MVVLIHMVLCINLIEIQCTSICAELELAVKQFGSPHTSEAAILQWANLKPIELKNEGAVFLVKTAQFMLFPQIPYFQSGY